MWFSAFAAYPGREVSLSTVIEHDILKDQKQASRLLSAFLKSGHFPPALLFTGIAGSGKKDAAAAFAMACNCEQSPSWVEPEVQETVFGSIPCTRCRSCRKIATGNHPDIAVLEPIHSVIKIERIRRLCHQLSLKPYEAKKRVAVIVDAHRLTLEAGNALLKVLEEPPPRTLLILTAPQRSDLLSTLVSRCHPVRFCPLPDHRIAAALQARFGLSQEQAALLAPMAHGSLSRAQAMAGPDSGSGNWLHQKRLLLSAARLDPTETRASDSLTLSLAFAERFSTPKERIPERLEILLSYLRDLMVLRWGSPHLINKDLTREMQYASQHVSRETLLAQLDAVGRAQRDIESNVNPRLVLETLMMDLSKGDHEENRRNPV